MSRLATYLAAPVFASITVPLPALPLSQSCVMLGPNSVFVRSHGVHVELPARFSDCHAVEVLAGRVTACYVDVRQQRQCVALSPGQHLSDVALTAPGAQSAGLWFAVVSLLRGDSHTKSAVSRGHSSVPYLPVGNVLLPGRAMSIALTDPRTAGATKFEIKTTNAAPDVVFALDNPGGAFEVPATSLRRGLAYTWRLRVPSGYLGGSFSIADETHDKDLQDARNLMNDSSLQTSARDTLLLELFNERGYFFERDITLKHLRDELTAGTD